MDTRSLLVFLLIGVLYPLWLLAGLVDYLCHRRSNISQTSGAQEAWLHVAQFISLGLAMGVAVSFVTTPLSLSLLIALVVVHTVLAYVDVAYTDGRRYISPLEQQAHAFMDVLPIVAICLIAVIDWGEFQSRSWLLVLNSTPSAKTHHTALIGSYFVLAGAPVFEELARTLRNRAR